MIYWQIFIANLIPNLLGYGGGPATIPLLEHEVVDRYGWFTTREYSEIVAQGMDYQDQSSQKWLLISVMNKVGF